MGSKLIRIVISAEPTAKGRPRTKWINGQAITYTPTKTKEAEDFIKFRLLRHKDQAFPAGVPLRLTCTFWRTKSRYLPRRESLPWRKPDLINFGVLICDALTGILYADDAQLTNIVMRKRWSPNGQGFITLKLEEDKLQGDNNADDNI
jgi:Holliday junction resolvase RusA-like endonuclease